MDFYGFETPSITFLEKFWKSKAQIKAFFLNNYFFFLLFDDYSHKIFMFCKNLSVKMNGGFFITLLETIKCFCTTHVAE